MSQHFMSRLLRQLIVPIAAVASLPDIAAAQFMAQVSCASNPGGAILNARVLSATCGSATFTVDATLRRHAEIRIVAANTIYIRKIRLTYGSSTGGHTQLAEVQLHRLLGAGETTDPVTTSRDGLGLQSVTVDVSPPGYGVDPVLLSLLGPDDAMAGGVNGARTDPTTSSWKTVPASDWMLIGSTFAHLPQLRDTVTIGRGKGRFDGLTIAARGNDLPVQSVVVTPVNGTPFSVDLRTIVTPGQLSAIIPIDPPDFIHDVSVTYATIPQPSRVPTLEIRGRYAESWLGRTGENRQYAGGWVMLGTVDVVVRPHSGARTGFRVDGQEGQFKKMRFVARRGTVDLVGVTIDAGDGRQETMPINALLVPDTQSAPFGFSTSAMPIAGVSLSPRLHAGSRIDASVEVWAQY